MLNASMSLKVTIYLSICTLTGCHDVDSTVYKNEALRLMKILQIPVRHNLAKDGPVNLQVIPNSSVGIFSHFKPDTPVINLNTPDVYYPKSKIIVMEDVLKSVAANEPTDSLEKLQLYNTRSLLIHEYTHYYQIMIRSKDYVDPARDRCAYYRQDFERWAYATQYLYTIKNCFPDDYLRLSAASIFPSQRREEIISFAKSHGFGFPSCP